LNEQRQKTESLNSNMYKIQTHIAQPSIIQSRSLSTHELDRSWSQSTMSGSVFMNDYLRQMRERQTKEQQLQALKNRVAILEGEDQRLRRRTIATKKRAAGVFYTKVLDEDLVR